MAEASQYIFSFEEIASLMIQKAGITNGLWTIGVGFKFTGMNAGINKDQIRPSALVSVEQLILSKAKVAGPLTFDAAEVVAKKK